MVPTMIIGNLVFATSVWGLYLYTAGDRSQFLTALVFGALTFFGGIVLGIFANQPKKKMKSKRRSTNGMPSAAAFEITE